MNKYISGQWPVAGGQNAELRTPRPKTQDPRPAPRGVLLLIVLALLAMFGLIAVAFIVLSGHAQRGAKSIERMEQVAEQPEKMLRQAFMQVARGPNTGNIPDPTSAVGIHSLLEDIYGNETLIGTPVAPITITGSAYVFDPGPPLGAPFQQLLNLTLGGGFTADELRGRVGCVLTITGVPVGANDAQKALYGQSSRIVAVNSAGTGVQVVAFPNGALPLVGSQVIINGVPFGGTGAGYNKIPDPLALNLAYDPNPANPSYRQLTDLQTNTWPVALLPNLPPSRYSTDATVNPYGNPQAHVFGGANEDYDAADYQNMMLAAQTADLTGNNRTPTIPSLHRPALVRYWVNRQGAASFQDLWNANDTNKDLCRMIMMRPIGQMLNGALTTPDHPNFDGGNPNFDPTWDAHFDAAAPRRWDVDNDGDGVPDSVWVDLGLPARQTADGRWYRPLFAILCVDLDGRLNLNAHGNLAQADTAANYSNVMSPGGGIPIGAPSIQVGRGQGLGPAEINLSAILPVSPTNVYQNLMQGNGTVQGRYGSAGVLNSTINPLVTPLCMNKWFEYGGCLPTDIWWDFSFANKAGSYGTPPDPFGTGAVGLDVAGRPVFMGMAYLGTDFMGYGSTLVRLPYQLDLGANAARGMPNTTADNPFSASELERVLRCYDRDAPGLPARLAALTTTTGNLNDSLLYGLRRLVTTDSFDLPCPNVVTPGSISGSDRTTYLGTDRRVKHITDLLRARNVPATEWAELLPADLLAGLRMDINRPFGNGRDDNGNGVVDEPGETLPAPGGPETVSLYQTATLPLVPVTPQVSYDGIGYSPTSPQANNSLEARQLEARHLYVLACLTCNLHEMSQEPFFNNDYTKVARFIAQWAVNAVDFRDRDSIMTMFEYDPRYADYSNFPTDGWHPITDGSCTVWGCERPELLISETLAFHDRRTENASNEEVDASEPNNSLQNGGKVVGPGDEDDKSFDQTYKPQGSLFVELYNPQSPYEPRSCDIYDSTNGGVELTKLTPASAGNRFPVWRIAVATSDDYNANSDPDEALAADQTQIYQEVYFVQETSFNGTLPAGKLRTDNITRRRFFPSPLSAKPLSISPGRYAVIGPGEDDATYQGNKKERTYIGYRTDGTPATKASSTRYIDLNPTGLPTGLPVQNNQNSKKGAAVAEPELALNGVVNQPETLAIDTPSRLNVSEPIENESYTDMEATIAGNTSDPYGKYTKPYDYPFDLKRTDDDANLYRSNHTQARHRVLFLQRLANPLLPFNAVTNPYRTVDRMAVDLTIFNGIADDTSDNQIQQGAITFESRQRGENNDTITAFLNVNMNIWHQEQINKTAWDTTLRTQADHVFPNGLKHSFGYLNHPFDTPAVTPSGELGMPSKPFPWLTWNNRPWASPLELLQVPCWHSSWLLGSFSTALAGNPYEDNPDKPFGHLINLMMSTDLTKQRRDLHRVLEYLRVPSPFVGAEVQANPTAALSGAHNFHPPFNRISTYREPGKININTIYDRNVFFGLMNGFPTMNGNTFWRKFVQSRRGYSTGNPLTEGDPLFANTDWPTEMGRPFRSFAGRSMTPDITIGAGKLAPDREIDSTLLRSDYLGADPTKPLFQYGSTQPVDNTDRNPYFRYQNIQRLGNLVTTRSNVYAVWITVGYFEVEPAPTKPAAWSQAEYQHVYPGGYQLGRELNVDTGEIERHRAFFIFDRSLPVGFMRGKDLNVEKAILVERFIE